MIAIAGTGSIVYGRDAKGHTARAGGWGFAISDEGSGHWIGRRAIAAVMSAHDQGVETVLISMILQLWRLGTLDELVQEANATPSPDFPRLLRIVMQAADGGDAVAGDLLAEAGAKLAALAAIVLRRLPLTSGRTATGHAPTSNDGQRVSSVCAGARGFLQSLQKIFPDIEVRSN